MKITLKEITIREVAKNYVDNKEEGVVGFDGKLNIRPPFQREFVYKEKQRDAVIETIRKGFPLNVMYWVVNSDGTYEVLDGQQRTVSFCQYVNGKFLVNFDGRAKGFPNLTETEKRQILDYKLMIYFCEGNDKEKLDWFRIINIAGEKLTEQELRNAVYTGTWLSDAKLKFSKSNCAAYLLAKDYVNGSPIRQEFLEKAIQWISSGDIEKYMSTHQLNPNANELWTYFKNVIEWVKLTFTSYRKEMKGLDWGPLYDKFKGEMFDTIKLEQEIQSLMMDDDVTSKKGVYPYLLTRNEKHLSLRAFSESQKRATYEKQKGICQKCGKEFELGGMEADHITPWSKGGKTNPENCQMLCLECNRRKSDA
ncbi:MAG: HNH endonuclease family protein [Thermoguttaceae bacterium]